MLCGVFFEDAQQCMSWFQKQPAQKTCTSAFQKSITTHAWQPALKTICGAFWKRTSHMLIYSHLRVSWMHGNSQENACFGEHFIYVRQHAAHLHLCVSEHMATYNKKIAPYTMHFKKCAAMCVTPMLPFWLCSHLHGFQMHSNQKKKKEKCLVMHLENCNAFHICVTICHICTFPNTREKVLCLCYH